MTYFIMTTRQICLLAAMLMMCSVSGRVIDNLREAAQTEPTMDDNTNNVRRQEIIVCGRIQTLPEKRDEGKEGSNDDDHSDHLDKILGGSDVTPGQVPWHAVIYVIDDRKCGGTIINEFWIVTSASCIIEASPDVLQVDVGVSQFYIDGYWVEQVVIHPKYSPLSSDYDIALIKVKPSYGTGIFFNNYVQPICLPDAGESPADNENLTVSGFGDLPTTLLTQSSGNLQTAVLPILNHTQCIDEVAPRFVTEHLLCIGRSNGTADVCILDYGGPATYQSGDTHILAGIIISGSYCIPPSNPVFLTNVLVFRNWIMDSIIRFSTDWQEFFPPRVDEPLTST